MENIQSKILYQRTREGFTTVSADQGERILSLSAQCKKNQALRHTCYDIVYGRKWLEEDTGRRILTHYHLAALAGVDPSNFCSLKAIQEVQEVFPLFAVRTYNYEKHKARVILYDGVSSELRQEMDDFERGDRVYISSFKKATQRKVLAACQELETSLRDITHCFRQLTTMTSYLHRRATSIYLDLWEKNGKRALALASTYNDGGQQAAIMRRIRDMPKPFYPPILNSNSYLARIFAQDHSYLASHPRKVLFAGCYEADLTSAHFSFLVMKYPSLMPRTREFLLSAMTQEGLSIWSAILATMEISQEEWSRAKKFLKPNTYSIQYGKNPGKAEQQLYCDLKGQVAFQEKYQENVYIQELIAATAQCKKDIERQGGMEGAFDWMKWDASMNIHSFMANGFQTFESALLLPCYLLAMRQEEHRNSTFQILLHQHDGFTPDFLPGKEKEGMKQLSGEVDKEAGSRNILTRLAFTSLQH